MQAGKLSIRLLIGLVCCCACGSSPRIVSRPEMIRYIQDKEHGLAQEQEINGMRVQVSYQPSSLLAAQELGPVQQLPKNVIDSVEKKYNKHYYFLLKLSKDGKEAIRQLGSFGRYSDMVQVLSFQMHRFVNCTTPQKDTVPLADYLFDQTYGMSDGNTVLLCFDKEKLGTTRELDVNLAECGLGTGSMKFRFDQKDIQKVPALDYRSISN
jgi:hypothetical protein